MMHSICSCMIASGNFAQKKNDFHFSKFETLK